LSRAAAERVAQAAREETGASHALAVLIEIDDGPDRIDLGGSRAARPRSSHPGKATYGSTEPFSERRTK
jgi:hypothetical protein